MNLSKVKLVVSDMDGTLLNSNHEISSDFFNLFEQLNNYIHFVAASGRQYQSIAEKFTPILDDITIIAENGGLLMQGGKELICTALPPEKIYKLITKTRKIKGAYTVLCGRKRAYIETDDHNFISLFSEFYNDYKIMKDLSEIPDDAILKIAVYHFDSSEKYLFPEVKHLEKEMKIKISGKNWLDISHFDANKGFALEKVQKNMGISKAETMVFGDYNNDLEMLELADFSFAMENAHENVKKAAKYHTASNDENGVVNILRELIKAKI